MRKQLIVALVLMVSAVELGAQTSVCRDIADEPSHHLVFQNDNVRIFVLDLAGSRSTEEFCVPHAYLRVIATEGKTADLVAGEVAYGQDWKVGEARFVYQPKRKTIRNETNVAFREYDIETLRPVEYNPLDQNYYAADLFGGDVGEFKADNTVSVTIGALKASKSSLATGQKMSLSDLPMLLIAITDVDLAHGRGKRLSLQRATLRSFWAVLC